MRCYLQNLRPETRFRVVGMPELTGVLIRCSDASATVRIDGGTRDALRTTTTTWAPATLVEPIASDPKEIAMSPKKTSKTSVTPKTKAAKPKTAATKQPKDASKAKPKKISALDAAARVLAGSKEPMNAKQMVEAMAAKGLWTSPGGKTPHATLYSAILREIGTKGKEARFKKHDRGKFGLA
jgi:hypothetical protein